MSERVIVKIVEQLPRSSENAPFKAKDGNGKTWTRWDHSWDSLLGKTVELREEVKVRDWQGRTMTDYIAHDVEEVKEDVEPKLGTGEYKAGQKSPVDALRIAASTAANNATTMTNKLLDFQTGREITPELYRGAWDAMFWHAFSILRTAGQIPDDDDIPF